ncbi:doublesex- and mab-3-related transcription factor 1B-like [Colossoma macropomum]|uniref:doublesex- and mab-3-related transcription factor 1B-like n=1 Tax=Colossoma macropomum TaxID=42526 RepID=UPI00186419B5|nr:doublesex- and mab-3-related transcription factor 1B-like [Colossoma macropomum]
MNSKDNNLKKARSPKCARCRNHGFAVELKGHSGKCPFLACTCWKCSLITERTKIMASQRRIRRGLPSDGGKTAAGGANGDAPGSGSRAAGDATKRVADTGSSGIPHLTVHGTRGLDGAVIRDPAHPWQCALTEMPQKNTYSGEMLGMVMPFQLSSHHPDSFVYPAFLVNVKVPPSGAVGAREAISVPYLPPLAYSPEPGVSQEGLVPCYASYLPYSWVQEECSPKPHPYALSSRENDYGTGGPSSPYGRDQGVVQVSQERDLIIVDNDFSSKDTA